MDKQNIDKGQWKALLKATNFFKTFNDEDIDKIIEYSKLLFFPMHKYIIKKSEEDLSFFVILKGHANVIRKDGLRRDQKILTINAGECFGEMAVITKNPRTNSIIAGSDCYVVKINASTLDSFDDKFQLKLYKQFAKILVNRLSKSDSFTL